MRALLASPLGFLIGLSLGAVGGGGSILAVPVLVYVAGQQPKEATTTSLVLVGSRVADRVDAKKLNRWFVSMILAVAAYTGVRSALAL